MSRCSSNTIIIANCFFLLLDGVPREDFPSGSGPIFVPNLKCPSSVSQVDDDTYVECLNEVVLGLSECGHEDDIGVHCEGIHIIVLHAQICIIMAEI